MPAVEHFSTEQPFFFLKSKCKMLFFLPLLILRPAQTADISLQRRDWTLGERKDKCKTSLSQSKRGENQVQSTSPSGELKR